MYENGGGLWHRRWLEKDGFHVDSDIEVHEVFF